MQKVQRRWREQQSFLLQLSIGQMARALLIVLIPPLFSNGYQKEPAQAVLDGDALAEHAQQLGSNSHSAAYPQQRDRRRSSH